MSWRNRTTKARTLRMAPLPGSVGADMPTAWRGLADDYPQAGESHDNRDQLTHALAIGALTPRPLARPRTHI